MTEDQKLQILRGYCERGFRIFPLKERSKEPLHKGGFHRATDNIRVVEAWHRRNPGANWGLYPGPSGVCVVDIDVRKGGDRSALGQLPDTLTVRTANGVHLYYLKPEGMRIGNDHRDLPGRWDIRCDGGYVVMPPSLHPQGGTRYEWEDATAPLAPLPETVRRRLVKAPLKLLEPPSSAADLRRGRRREHEDQGVESAMALLSALSPRRADDYDQWIRVGMALRSLGDAGLALWDDWSRQSEKYKPGECAAKWETFNETTVTGAGLTPASLRYWAREDSSAERATSEHQLSRRHESPGPSQRASSEHQAWRRDDSPPPPDETLKVSKPLGSAGQLGRAPGNPVPEDYRKALLGLGYAFRLNETNDDVLVNGVSMNDVTRAVLYFRLKNHGYTSERSAEDAWTFEASNHKFHPILDYLTGLEWDGRDHIGRLCAYFEDKQGVFPLWLKRWLIGAVARVMAAPRGQQNRMLILDGRQDLGKSYFTRWLARGVPRYYIEAPILPEDKDSYVRKMSKWIWEVGELGATTRKADRESLKHFLSQEKVTVRKSYGRHDTEKPALANYIGTINNEVGFLNDPTGSRRFMACTLTRIDWDYAKDVDPDQVWAQAVALFRAGEPWELTPEEKALANSINGQYEVENPVDQYLFRYFEIDPARREWVLPTSEIIDVLRRGELGGADPHRLHGPVAAALRALSLENRRRRFPNYSSPVSAWEGIRVKPQPAQEPGRYGGRSW